MPEDFLLPHRLEDATKEGKFNYWLTIEDVGDIARITYKNYRSLATPSYYKKFLIISNPRQLDIALKNLLENTDELKQGRLTFILKLGPTHWASLVIHYKNQQGITFYLDSSGQNLPQLYKTTIRDFGFKPFINLSKKAQQTDVHNCGLWALENAEDLSKMVDENQSLLWLSTVLKRSRDNNYFEGRRRSLSDKLGADPERQARLQSHDNPMHTNQVPLDKPATARGFANSDENPPKKQKIIPESTNNRLRLFVDRFNRIFLKELPEYYKTARKSEYFNLPEAGNKLRETATGMLFGGLLSGTRGGVVPAAAAAYRKLTDRSGAEEIQNAKKIMRAFELAQPQGKISKDILIPVAIYFFQSYEQQMMSVTDELGFEIAMDKLAVDAVERCFDYLKKNLNENTVISSQLISEAILLGKSKQQVEISMTHLPLIFYGYWIQDADGKRFTTSNFYEQVGLKISTSQASSDIFYRPKDRPDGTKYGYRYPLNWETDAGLLKSEYQDAYIQEEEVTLELYSYTLNTITLEEIRENLLSVIKPATSRQPSSEEMTPITDILFEIKGPIRNFFGRTQALNDLDALLNGAHKVAVITQQMTWLTPDQTPRGAIPLQQATQTAISGLGGIGKTQLALRYANLYAADYDNNILWIGAETLLDIANNFKQLALKLNIDLQDYKREDKSIETLAEDIYNYFSGSRCLIIFDNVENYQSIKNILPKASSRKNPTILMTSRYNNWEGVASCLNLDVFSEIESINFLKTELYIEKNNEDTPLKILHQLTGGLPLAQQQALSTFKLKRKENSLFSVQNYIDIFRTKNQELLNHPVLTHNDPYTKTVWTTWNILEGELRKDLIKRGVGEKGIEILYMMAFFNSDSIENSFFRSFLGSEQDLGLIFHTLESYSIIGRGLNSAESSLHRLFQTVLRFDLNRDNDRRIKIINEVIKIQSSHKKEAGFISHAFNIILHMAVYKQAEGGDLSANYLGLWQIIMNCNYDALVLNNLLDTAYLILPKNTYPNFLAELNILSLQTSSYTATEQMVKNIQEKLNRGLLSQEEVKLIFQHPKFSSGKYEYEFSSEYFDRKNEAASKNQAHIVFNYLKHSLICPKQVRKRRDLSAYCSRPNYEILTEAPLDEHSKAVYWKKIQQIRQSIHHGTQGFIAKNILSDLMQGHVQPWIELAIVSSSGQYLGDYLSMEASKRMLGSESLFLGSALKVSSIFLQRCTSTIFFTYNFVKSLNRGNTDLLEALENLAIITLDITETSIEAAEAIGLLTASFSAITGPISELIIFLLMADIEINHINRQLTEIEKWVHLSLQEKIQEGLRAFFNRLPSERISKKIKNTQQLNKVIEFLKTHPEIKKYIFPAETSDATAKRSIALDSLKTLKVENTIPDKPSEGDFFCLPGTILNEERPQLAGRYPAPWIEKTQSYVCTNAMGFTYTPNSGHLSLIALQEGDDVVRGPMTDTIILLNNGNKHYTLGPAKNLAILQGNAITGVLNGSLGFNNCINFAEYHPASQTSVLFDKKGFICGAEANTESAACRVGLEIIGFTHSLGRTNQQDTVFISEKMNYIDMGGGTNDEWDHIYVNENSSPFLNIVLRANTAVKSLAENRLNHTLRYTVHHNQNGKAQIEFPVNGQVIHQFYFETGIENVLAILAAEDLTGTTLQIQNSGAKFELNIKPINATVSYADVFFLKHSTFIFKENVILKLLTDQSLYLQLHADNTVDKIIQQYAPIAQRLKKAIVIRTANKEVREVISIGGIKRKILSADGVLVNHLVGNAGDSVYVIKPPKNITRPFPLKDITLHKIESSLLIHSTDTLDLRDLLMASKQACDILLTPLGNDLILNVIGTIYRNPITKIILKKLLIAGGYQDMNIITLQTQPQKISFNEANRQWQLTSAPLVFNRHKNIILISHNDLSANDRIYLYKNRGPYEFLRHEGDLLLTNSKANVTAEEIYTLIFPNFFQNPSFKSKVLSLTSVFSDHYLVFKDHQQEIENAPYSATSSATLDANSNHPLQRQRREILTAPMQTIRPVLNPATHAPQPQLEDQTKEIYPTLHNFPQSSVFENIPLLKSFLYAMGHYGFVKRMNKAERPQVLFQGNTHLPSDEYLAENAERFEKKYGS